MQLILSLDFLTEAARNVYNRSTSVHGSVFDIQRTHQPSHARLRGADEAPNYVAHPDEYRNRLLFWAAAGGQLARVSGRRGLGFAASHDCGHRANRFGHGGAEPVV